MDSINKNQPEDNHEDLSGAKAVTKMAELIKKAETCFFTTKMNSKRFTSFSIDTSGAPLLAFFFTCRKQIPGDLFCTYSKLFGYLFCHNH